MRSLAESALKAGLRPVCVDLFCDADLKGLLSEAGLPPEYSVLIPSLEDADTAIVQIDQSVPLVPIGGLEGRDQTLERIARDRTVLSMTPSAIKFLRNPQKLFTLLGDSGCSVPEVAWAPEEACMLPAGVGSWLRKDSSTSGGQGVHRIPTDLLGDVLAKMTPSEFVQEEINGVPCSATFLADGKGYFNFLGSVLQLSGEPALNATGFQFCGNAGPIKLAQSSERQLKDVVTSLSKHCVLQGVFGIDFILQHHTVRVIEVNPRLTASHELHEANAPPTSCQLLQHLAAFDSVTKLPDSTNSNSKKQPQNPGNVCCIRMVLYSDRNFVLNPETFDALLRYRRALNNTAAAFWISDLPASETKIAAGSPFCSLNIVAPIPSELNSVWEQVGVELQGCLEILDSDAIDNLIRKTSDRWVSITT